MDYRRAVEESFHTDGLTILCFRLLLVGAHRFSDDRRMRPHFIIIHGYFFLLIFLLLKRS